MAKPHKILHRMLAEMRRVARLYFAPLTAAWGTMRQGGGYASRLLSVYRQNGLL